MLRLSCVAQKLVHLECRQQHVPHARGRDDLHAPISEPTVVDQLCSFVMQPDESASLSCPTSWPACLIGPPATVIGCPSAALPDSPVSTPFTPGTLPPGRFWGAARPWGDLLEVHSFKSRGRPGWLRYYLPLATPHKGRQRRPAAGLQVPASEKPLLHVCDITFKAAPSSPSQFRRRLANLALRRS